MEEEKTFRSGRRGSDNEECLEELVKSLDIVQEVVQARFSLRKLTFSLFCTVVLFSTLFYLWTRANEGGEDGGGEDFQKLKKGLGQ